MGICNKCIREEVCKLKNENIGGCIYFKAKSSLTDKGWNNHKVACLLADMFGDTCACNHNGIDEWLPKYCDFANKECPDVVGVACWEQFLKYRDKEKKA